MERLRWRTVDDVTHVRYATHEGITNIEHATWGTNSKKEERERLCDVYWQSRKELECGLSGHKVYAAAARSIEWRQRRRRRQCFLRCNLVLDFSVTFFSRTLLRHRCDVTWINVENVVSLRRWFCCFFFFVELELDEAEIVTENINNNSNEAQNNYYFVIYSNVLYSTVGFVKWVNWVVCVCFALKCD